MMLNRANGQSRKAALEAALTRVVYTNINDYVLDQAREHTIANMGMDILDHVNPKSPPEKVVLHAWYDFCNLAESDEMLDSFEEEKRSWLRQSADDAKKVQKEGLPLTLANARMAFEFKGPFEKYCGSKASRKGKGR